MSDFNIEQMRSAIITLMEDAKESEKRHKEIQTQLLTINDALTAQKEREDHVKNYETDWDSFLIIEIEKTLSEFFPQFAETKAKSVVDTLKASRRNGDYRTFVSIYFEFKASENLKLRQFLKLVSACDRIKYYEKHPQAWKFEKTIANAKSELKFAKMCPHCGSTANMFYTRMEQEKLA